MVLKLLPRMAACIVSNDSSARVELERRALEHRTFPELFALLRTGAVEADGPSEKEIVFFEDDLSCAGGGLGGGGLGGGELAGRELASLRLLGGNGGEGGGTLVERTEAEVEGLEEAEA